MYLDIIIDVIDFYDNVITFLSILIYSVLYWEICKI